MPSPSSTRTIAAALAGGSMKWDDLGMNAGELLAFCDAEELAPLLHHRLRERGADREWPEGVASALAARARQAAAEELLRGVETRALVQALARAGVRALLIKGTPLAYTVYPTPASRPRSDTDLLIAEHDVESARAVFASMGFAPTVSCDSLFSQFEVKKHDRFGVTHAYDVHWRISTQPVFADVLTYGEMAARAMPVPALGDAAFAASIADALLLACVHPVMHHRNDARLLWRYDIVLLASRLTPAEARRFAALACERRVAAVCAHQLRRAQEIFGTPDGSAIVAELAGADADEPSAEYLASKRTWQHEVLSGLRAVPRVGDRLRLVRQVLFPGPAYMLGAYGLRDNTLGPLLLPALYMHRNVRGAWRILTGRK
jgi:hypothetical protein